MAIKKTLKEHAAEAAAANGREMTDEEWEAAGHSPDEPRPAVLVQAADREQVLVDMEAAGQLDETPTESDADDSEPKKERVPMEDFERIGWAEEDEALNIVGILQGYTERAGTVDVTVEIKFVTVSDPELSARLTEVVQTVAFSAKYAGRDLGVGATVRQFTAKADADGHPQTDIVIRLPENQRTKLKNIVGLSRSRGVMALTPLQLAIDLTTRAE